MFNITVMRFCDLSNLSGPIILLKRMTSKTRPVGDLNIFLPSEV